MFMCTSFVKSPVCNTEVALVIARGEVWSRLDIEFPCAVQIRLPLVSMRRLAQRLCFVGPGPFSFRYLELDSVASTFKHGFTFGSMGEQIDLVALREKVDAAAECNRAFQLLRRATLPWHKQCQRHASHLRLRKHRKRAGVLEKSDSSQCDSSDSSDRISHLGTDLKLAGGSDSEVSSEPPPAVPAPAVPPPRHALEIVNVRTYGYIKIDRLRRQFNAHCAQLGPPHPKDHRTPTMDECRMNRQGAKKPLAFLVQWLIQAANSDTHNEHMASKLLITYEQRLLCRDWIMEEECFAEIRRLEAEWSGQDESYEPVYIS